jgi:hypothetical protein
MNAKGIRPGIYRHYKGDEYQVFGTGLHSETHEEFVVYKHLDDNGTPEDHFWIRPREMFLENVTQDGKQVPRFEFLREAGV